MKNQNTNHRLQANANLVHRVTTTSDVMPSYSTSKRILG
jgi:hypothetical protein